MEDCQTFEIYGRLSNDGKVKKRPKDFQSRLGVTQEPLIDFDLQMISPLHTMLRTWDFIFKLLCFLKAETYIFSPEENVLKDKYDDYKKSKKYIINKIQNDTHITIEVPDPTGKGGTTTNGNTVSNILGNYQNRKVLSNFVPEHYRDAMVHVILRLWIIMKIYNSNDEVNDYFDEFCRDTCMLILTSFNKDQPWIYIYPLQFTVFFTIPGN